MADNFDNNRISEGAIKDFVCKNKAMLLPVLFYFLDKVAQKKWWLAIGMGAVKKLLEELLNGYCDDNNQP